MWSGNLLLNERELMFVFVFLFVDRLVDWCIQNKNETKLSSIPCHFLCGQFIHILLCASQVMFSEFFISLQKKTGRYKWKELDRFIIIHSVIIIIIINWNVEQKKMIEWHYLNKMIIIIIDISNQNKMLEMVSLYCNIDGKIDLINDHRYGQHTYLSKKKTVNQVILDIIINLNS